MNLETAIFLRKHFQAVNAGLNRDLAVLNNRIDTVRQNVANFAEQQAKQIEAQIAIERALGE